VSKDEGKESVGFIRFAIGIGAAVGRAHLKTKDFRLSQEAYAEGFEDAKEERPRAVASLSPWERRWLPETIRQYNLGYQDGLARAQIEAVAKSGNVTINNK